MYYEFRNLNFALNNGGDEVNLKFVGSQDITIIDRGVYSGTVDNGVSLIRQDETVPPDYSPPYLDWCDSATNTPGMPNSACAP